MTSNSKPQSLISPAVLPLLIGSLLVFLSTVFFGQWTSSGPTFLPSYLVNPDMTRVLPSYLQLPGTPEEIALPAIAILIMGLGLRWVPLNNWTRLIVKLMVPVLATRYLVWRLSSTLNFHHWTSAVFSITLLGLELSCHLSLMFYTFQTIWSTDGQRQKEADRHEKLVLSGEYQPSVDVFIPTYNEPAYIVQRTVIGVQAMNYANKTVYILDDTRRSEMRDLAKTLGCEYITRQNNDHAKAGNLNNALKHTQGELIALIDADFVPFRNFLDRTIGFFSDPQNSLVQTPQNFYNPDYHARNLGLTGVMPNDLEHFYGTLQSHRDVANSVICCGSSYVVRRTDIEAIDGYFTKCCVEDYQTSIKLLLNGARIVYLNETLSMGESTRTFIDFLDQRLRWLQGNFQVYFCGKELPIWRLNWIQRTFLVNQFIHCFQSVFRFGFLVSPIISLYSGVAPFVAPLSEVIYYFAPFWFLLLATHGWSADYRSSQFWAEVHEVTFCFPGLKRLGEMLRQPFGKVSKVTRKGVKAQAKNYNWPQNLPLLVLLALSLGGLGLNLYGSLIGWWPMPGINLLPQYFWVAYNAVILTVAILSSIDQPVRRTLDRFPLQTNCHIVVAGQAYRAVTLDLSEQGARIVLLDSPPWEKKPRSIALTLGQDAGQSFNHNRLSRNTTDGETSNIVASVVRWVPDRNELQLEFTHIPLCAQRQLIELLYCDHNDWKQRRKLGGADALIALFLSLIQLRPIFKQYND
jgi:cellulose synthase (UDP-forming)